MEGCEKRGNYSQIFPKWPYVKSVNYCIYCILYTHHILSSVLVVIYPEECWLQNSWDNTSQQWAGGSMALQMKTHHAASTAYRVRATCGIQKVLSSVLGCRLHFFPHVVASRQVEMISAFHLELDLFQFASEILDNLLRHDFIKKIKPIISPCFFVGNLRSYINPHASVHPHQSPAMAQLKPLSEKLQEIMETCEPLEIEGVSERWWKRPGQRGGFCEATVKGRSKNPWFLGHWFYEQSRNWEKTLDQFFDLTRNGSLTQFNESNIMTFRKCIYLATVERYYGTILRNDLDALWNDASSSYFELFGLNSNN